MDPALRHLWSRLRLVNSEIAFARERLDDFAQLHRLATAQLPEYDFDDRHEHQNQLFHSITSAYAKLRTTIMDLEPQRDQLRATINSRLRPTQRPLNILDLPDELLMHIFAYAREHDDPLYFNASPLPGEAHDIKNLRLACRRFCDTSSHLLVRCLRVDMTNPSSIQHLDQVSRHPTISKGIRGIIITLEAYNPTYANNIREFALNKAYQLEEAVEVWEDYVHFREGPFREGPFREDPAAVERYQNAIAVAEPIKSCWHHIAQHGLEAENGDDEPSRALLQRAHDEYRRLYNEWSVLQAGGFVAAVVPALARMGTAMWLDIRDASELYETFEHPDTISLGDMADPDLLCKKMVVPDCSWHRDELARLLVDVFLKLLLASQQADIRLTGLDIGIPLPPIMPALPDESYLKLRSLVQHLKVFDFHHSTGLVNKEFWQSKHAQAWQPCIKFFTALLDTSSLRRIAMDFGFLSCQPLRPVVSIGPVLTSRTWPKLRLLSLRIPFNIDDIKRVVAGAPKDMRLRLSGYLMNGSWVEVLEILKERGSECSEIISCASLETVPQGQECERMTYRQQMYVFCDMGRRSSNNLNRATMYVIGSEAYPTNPVQDWKDGKLAIQVPEGGNNGA